MSKSKNKYTFFRIFLTLSILLFIAGCATTKQLPPAEPSKTVMERANRVIVTIDESPELAFKNVGQYISDLGFELRNTNESLLNIQTNFRTLGNPPFGTYTFRLNVSIRDSSIHFYAYSGIEILGNVDGINSSWGKEWVKLVGIATGYPHQEVYYSRY